jgi:phage baseplate assembly protein W
MRIDPVTGGWKVQTIAVEQVKDELYQLALTCLRERIMLPDFGTTIYERIYDFIDYKLAYVVEHEINTACSYWMPHVNINYASASFKDTIVEIYLEGTVDSRDFELKLPLKEGV